MSVVNLVIFLIAVAGLALLVVQNFSTKISLVFLGSQSPEFPLSFWILIAIAVGVILSLLIWSLFQVSGGGSGVSRGSSSRRPHKPPVQPMGFATEPSVESSSSNSTTQNYATTSTTSSQYAKSKTTHSTTSNSDDWETEVRPIRQSWDEEDWGLDEEEPVNFTSSQTRLEENEDHSEAFEEFSNEEEAESPHRDHYEVEQKPKRESWSGSVYSYGYREGGDTGVGKSESVYDADYRIITPPPSSTEIQEDSEEDSEELAPGQRQEISSSQEEDSDNSHRSRES